MTTSSPESHPTPTDIPLVPIDLRPATPNLELHSVPFPVVEMLKPQESRSPSPEPNLEQSESSKPSPDSQATSSSKLTSSDKLSALPAPSTTPNRMRSPNLNRGFRSLDASSTLPSYASDLDSFASNPAWNANNSSNNNNPNVTFPRATVSEGSLGKETPNQRVSFESDRISLSTMQSVRQAFSRLNRGSDPTIPSPALRPTDPNDQHPSQKDLDSNNFLASPSPSHSRSRAASPLRIFQQWSASLHRPYSREDPFVPINPFKSPFRFPCFSDPANSSPHESDSSPSSDHPYDCDDTLKTYCIQTSTLRAFLSSTNLFLTDTLPRQIYINLLLRLPSLYFSRVARIFQDAEVSRPDIQRIIDAGGAGFVVPSASEGVYVSAAAAGGGGGGGGGSIYGTRGLTPGAPAGIGLTTQIGAAAAVNQMPLPFPEDWTPPLVSPALVRFKNSWEAFIDSLLREWKTLNVVSALLLSAILTMFQIPSAEGDPVTRTAAMLSLICALMSLTYGCMYIVRFGTMRSMYKASRWAEEARKRNTLIWWNVWVLLAMPVVWMAWSMVFFIVSILSFVWRTGSVLDPVNSPPLPQNAALGTRIAITGVFGLGMVYFVLIVKTLKRYGTHLGGRDTGRMGSGMSGGMNRNGVGLRAREIDAAMERRGRERERSGQRGVRRREEDVERRDDGEGEMDGGKERERSGLRMVLGLGLSGVGADTLEVDLEKGEGDEMGRRGV